MNRKFSVLAASALLASLAVPAQAYDAGDWIFRAGVGTVDPKSNNLSIVDDTVAPPLSVGVNVDSGTSLTLMGTYMFTKNWAFDVLASWPFKHDIDATVSDGQTTVTFPLASTEHLPPTFSVQYHFMPDGQFQPYVGAGVNYTTFFSIKEDAAATDPDVLGPFSLKLDDSWGLAAQIGADWLFNENWLINLDVRWINIETDAKVDGEKIGTVVIDPIVYSVNIGYKF